MNITFPDIVNHFSLLTVNSAIISQHYLSHYRNHFYGYSFLVHYYSLLLFTDASVTSPLSMQPQPPKEPTAHSVFGGPGNNAPSAAMTNPPAAMMDSFAAFGAMNPPISKNSPPLKNPPFSFNNYLKAKTSEKGNSRPEIVNNLPN
jgi:hypothetical protein